MNPLLPPLPLLFAFFIELGRSRYAGRGVLYIIARSLIQGPRAGMFAAAGIALGNLRHALYASIGVAALVSLHLRRSC